MPYCSSAEPDYDACSDPKPFVFRFHAWRSSPRLSSREVVASMQSRLPRHQPRVVHSARPSPCAERTELDRYRKTTSELVLCVVPSVVAVTEMSLLRSESCHHAVRPLPRAQVSCALGRSLGVGDSWTISREHVRHRTPTPIPHQVETLWDCGPSSLTSSGFHGSYSQEFRWRTQSRSPSLSEQTPSWL